MSMTNKDGIIIIIIIIIIMSQHRTLLQLLTDIDKWRTQDFMFGGINLTKF